MGTSIRPELAKSNQYWIEKHRYYELKHFCLQYPTWRKAYNSIDGIAKRPDLIIFSNEISDPTAKAAMAREYFYDRMKLVENCCKEADPVVGEALFEAVTTGCSYEVLKSRIDIPCCKDVYYDLYRQFFWLLNIARR